MLRLRPEGLKPEGCAELGAFAGLELVIRDSGPFQLALPLFKSCFFADMNGSTPGCTIVTLALDIRRAMSEVEKVTGQKIRVIGYVGAEELNQPLREL